MLSKVIAIAAVLAFSVQSATADCSRSYTIKAGDYCDKISASEKVSTFQLAAVNNDKINDKCTNLAVGDNLCLGNTGEDCTDTYTVKSGDTCTSILGGTPDVNATILYHNNPQINEGCTNIYVGEVLCVSKTVQVPAIPSKGVVIPVSGPPATPDDSTSTAITVTAAATPAANVAAAPTSSTAPPTPDADDDCDDDADADANTGAGADDGADGADGDYDDDDDLPYCDEIDE